jgi:hypothetical protein
VNGVVERPLLATRGRPDELRALSGLAFDEVGRLTGGIGQIHDAIAHHAFCCSGAGAAHLTHDRAAGRRGRRDLRWGSP